MNSTLEPVHAHAPAHADAPCPNCNAPAPGKFCAACGESTTVHSPSAFEFVHEFVGHYVALEGKLWTTLRLLMFKPGQLTAQYLQGRRVRYVNPLRVYLTLSLVMFALIKLYGVELPQLAFDATSFGIEYSHTVPDPNRPGEMKTATLQVNAHERGEKLAPLETAITQLGNVNPTWRDNVQRFMNEPAERKAEVLNRGFLGNVPYMLIGALPLFALYLKLIYFRTGRYYGEHLVFALHANAFAFLLASIMIMVPGNVVWLAIAACQGLFAHISAWDWFKLLPFVWLVAYLPVAMQRVYGGSRLATCGRWLLLIAAHLLVLSALIVAAEVIGILKYSH